MAITCLRLPQMQRQWVVPVLQHLSKPNRDDGRDDDTKNRSFFYFFFLNPERNWIGVVYFYIERWLNIHKNV